MSLSRQIKCALISTSDKTGLVEFAQELTKRGVEILATSGTVAWLSKQGVPVLSISDYIGFSEKMDGRVKTLHPKIYVGLLWRPGIDDVLIEQYQAKPIDLLVINLYPFQQTAKNTKASLPEVIEQIDVGGPSLLRAGAKNFTTVTTVIDPSDYSLILREMDAHQGATSLTTRHHLAQKTFSKLTDYDAAIANYLAQQTSRESPPLFPADFQIHFHKKTTLRYGENPHQQAALYTTLPAESGTLAHAELLQGTSLSFNNLVDANTAMNCVCRLPAPLPGCVIVKHATPCGAAQADSQLSAYEKAYSTDPTSAFGGIIAFNTPLEGDTVKKIIANKHFVELMVAPTVTPEALQLLSTKPQVRVLALGSSSSMGPSWTWHSISGGLLLQQADNAPASPQQWRTVTQRQPTPKEQNDLWFAWEVAKFVKSNAIVYAKNQATLGIGAGQTSRVFAAKIAILKAQEAGLSLTGAVMASDAFFPFADSIEVAAEAGITAIIQPGGSKRDAEVIEAANHAHMSMVLTGTRHFRH